MVLTSVARKPRQMAASRCVSDKLTMLLRPALTVLLLLAVWPAVASAQVEAKLHSAVDALNARSFVEKLQAAEQLAELDDPRVEAVLQALLEGRLFYRRDDKRVVRAERKDRGYILTDVLSDTPLGEVARRSVRKISVNNSLRRQLRGLIAGRQINHADPEIREQAVYAIVDAADVQMLPLLNRRAEVEQHADVVAALSLAKVVFDLEGEDASGLTDAIARSRDFLHPAVRVRLNKIQSSDQLPHTVRSAASDALLVLAERESRYQMLETLFFGLSLGSILVLAAIGLAITFGVMGVINMAHGELMMLGAYTTYVVQLWLPDALEYSLLIALPVAFFVSASVGIAIERGVVQFLYGRPLETLLATFGVSLILQQAVRSVFSPLNRSVSSPEWMSGSLEITQGLAITYNRLYIFIFAMLVFAALWMILKRTRLGLEVRAVTQNRHMAQAMGVRSARVDMLTFGLGSGVAGIAGVALSQLTNVGPNLGQSYIVDSFMVVVFGGVGNLWGTLIAGLSLGVVNKFLEPVAGAVMAKVLVLVFIILFIQRRPQGLFPQKGRAAES